MRHSGRHRQCMRMYTMIESAPDASAGILPTVDLGACMLWRHLNAPFWCCVGVGFADGN
jgi:hypothetical protein